MHSDTRHHVPQSAVFTAVPRCCGSAALTCIQAALWLNMARPAAASSCADTHSQQLLVSRQQGACRGPWACERQVSHGQSHMADDEEVNVCFAGRAAIQEEGEDGGPNRLGGLQSEGSV